ncbi:MAG: hypothetical protein J6K91_05945 [Opitutales bacterium]|nr:hypothetical protein [Opitutales bacterium]
MDVSHSVSGGFCFWHKKMCASALKQYTQVDLKTGFVNNFIDFCKKNRLRGGKRFVAGCSGGKQSQYVDGCSGGNAGNSLYECSKEECCSDKAVSVEAAFLFLFWLQTWLHNLQFALNTAFASVKQVSIIQSVYSGSGWKSGRDAVCGRCLSVVSDVSALGVSVASVVAVAVSQGLTGYAFGFQDWQARGEGARPPTTRSTHLWVCYQKFFRFWANAKTQTQIQIAMCKNAQNMQKHATQVLYIALDLLNCLLKNKNTPALFTFEWTKNALKNKKSSALICYQKFFRFWAFYTSILRLSPKVSLC